MKSLTNLTGHLTALVLALAGLTGLIALLGSRENGSAPSDNANKAIASNPTKTWVSETYSKLPLSFEANHGQTDSQVKFLAHGNSNSLFLTSNEAVLTLNENPQSATRSFGSFMEFPYAKPQTSLRSKDLSEPMSALLPAESALVSPVNTLSALSTIRYFQNSTERPARNPQSAVLRMK